MKHFSVISSGQVSSKEGRTFIFTIKAQISDQTQLIYFYVSLCLVQMQ